MKARRGAVLTDFKYVSAAFVTRALYKVKVSSVDSWCSGARGGPTSGCDGD